MSIYLAIDAGGTKTDYLLADETRELARSRSGTIKRLRTDAATAAENLDRGLGDLSAASGVAMSSVTCTCIGTAGESVPLVRDWLREALAARVSGDLILVGDVEIALDAAFRGGPGVVVIAGTGSNVAGRGPDGTLTTAGGWGPALADQGSGHRIGLEALRAAFLARDEGRSSLLLAAVMEFWQLASLDQLVEMANRTPAPDFSKLTEVVLRCAQQGDAVAASVLSKEGEDLAQLVRIVLRRLNSASANGSVPPVAFSGSILERVQPLRDTLLASIRREFPAVRMLDEHIDPLLGALWRARSHSA